MKTFPYLGAFISSINKGNLEFQHKLKSDFTIVGVDTMGKYSQNFTPSNKNIESNIKIGSTIFTPGIKIYLS